jgi:hypothetical protein
MPDPGLTLVLGTSHFRIAAQDLCHHSSLLADRPGLQTYTVQTDVSPQTFRAFLDAIEAGSDLPLTPDNVPELSLLCEEFGAVKLKRACDHFVEPVPIGPAVQFRFENIELAFEESEEKVVPAVKELTRKLAQLTRHFGDLKADVGRLTTSLAELRHDFKTKAEVPLSQLSTLSGKLESCQTENQKVRASIAVLTAVVETPYLRSLTQVPCPMKGENSLDGIISHLTKKHGGNVHEKGIVTITSKSVNDENPRTDIKSLADLTSNALFCSENAPDQWVCWDFRDMRVCPTHYTLTGYRLKSWVLEQSLDGQTWTEIDWQTGNQDFAGDRWTTASFAVSSPAACRFIRLTQTGPRHDGADWFSLKAAEFFGTVCV